MARATSALLLAASALFVMWVVRPASSAPPQEAVVPARSPLPAASPELGEINREVDRLRERLSAPVSETVPERDPFRFGDRVLDEGHAARFDRDALIADQLNEPTVAWPALVAILSSGRDDVPTRRAVFEDAAQLVQIRSVGETIGDVTVTAIDADVVIVTHPSSGESTHLALR